MKYTINVKRQADSHTTAYYQSFSYEGSGHTSIAVVLRELNRQNSSNAIAWDCGCMVRKCGACGMLINNTPRLACSTFLDEFKGKTITLEPFSKFPLVKDLITDKTTMFESLTALETFLKSEAYQSNATHRLRYMSAKCIMCGCCLEICPNFNLSADFVGAIGAVNVFRILDNEQNTEHRAVVSKRYTERFFNGCGKSLACQNVCPMGIPIDELTARSNAIAVWKK